ncbi:putative F-box/kelch-repeat protein At3g24610 isoform X2 [Eutrema salsugineum]|uniref:putative F-box/kelch-repeat protein At3g24610 isoform X2 n=1 Tax=Eutrema salsugineum TaxID=72664 RepID=UPI000CECE40F|nr:putative F-box/kelch-repeat protein At3g24610 isoform X2 [Eutrema salsugineum]XP_024016416.1 putative F-box/kelch-repeat protein At3g24610 isoform X2 [Eutrema salsugineum]
MSNSAIEEPPHKKRKTCLSPSALSLLPDEIFLSCMSRVSRSDQAALSLVSRSYRSLVASPELYKMRSLYGCTENCVYVCLVSPPDPNPRWFILLRENRLLSPIPNPSFPPQAPEGSSVVALDWGIYVIGGLRNGKPTSEVWLLDCRTHTWRQVPSMGVGRVTAAAGVVGGKIYVFGGCWNPDSSNWAEVYDPKTQTWEALPPMPDRKTRCQLIHDSVVVKEERVYAVDHMETTLYYSPSEKKWGRGNHSELHGYKRDWCVINNIIYSCDRFGELRWCEQAQLECSEPEGEGMYWRKVQGLGSLKDSLSSSRLVHFDGRFDGAWESLKIGLGVNTKLIDVLPGARLIKSGPNLVLFWDVIEGDHLEIWCAVISLERRQGPEIWGNIDWSHPLKTVEPFSHHHKIMHILLGVLLKCF